MIFVDALVVALFALVSKQYVIAQYLLEDGKQVSNTKHEAEMPGVLILVVVVLLTVYVASMLGLLALLILMIIKDSSFAVDHQLTNGLWHQHVHR